MIYWCDSCNIPIIQEENCGSCGSKVREIASDIRPVFTIEKILLSVLLEEDLLGRSVWNSGSIRYIVDGQTRVVNYVEIKKNIKMQENLLLKYKEAFACNDLEQLIKKNQNVEFEDSSIRKFIGANKQYLIDIENEANNYINEIIEKFGTKGYQPIVSFSGGKDSTVVSNLVREALSKQDVLHLFGDTTLEFPTTYEYLERFKLENPFVPFIFSKSHQNFFDLCKEFGPPSRLERWCCTIFKTGPIGGEINNFAENTKAISFVGIRGSESKSRKAYQRTQNKSKISRQVISMPIHNWKDCAVWLYIMSKGLDFNSAYNIGFSRVGCWCCPNNSNRSDFLLKLNFSGLFEKWRNVLLDYTKKAGIEDYDVYIEDNYWKARRGLRGLQKLDTVIKSQECNLSDNARTYKLGNSDTQRVLELFKPFGKIMKTFEDELFVKYNVKHNNFEFDIHISKNGEVLKILPLSVGDIILFYKRIECQIRKIEFCIGCMACDSICPFDAISTVNGYYIIEVKCKHCLKCVAKFTGGCLRVEKHKSKL